MRSTPLAHVLCVADFERLAKQRLPKPLFAYVSGACEDNRSLYENRNSFARYSLNTRVLVDVSVRNQEISLFGQRYSAPFGIAPMGIVALSSYRGDVELAVSAQRVNIPCIMSGWSLVPLEQVAKSAPQTWFQAYLSRRTDQAEALIDRVERAGFTTLVITVDVPTAANRENNVRAGFSSPLRPTARLLWQGISHPRWLSSVFLKTLLKHGIPHFENWHGGRGAAIFAKSIERDIADRGHLTWDHLATIRNRWKGRLVLKGILNPADAKLAAGLGVDGIIVSNHGGRQLDGAVAPLHVLPSILESFRDGPVMLDSGVRRGTDVVKALALGAACVFVGRPFNYAAAVAGSRGIEHAATLLQQEISRNMAMMGVTSADQLNPSFLVQTDPMNR